MKKELLKMVEALIEDDSTTAAIALHGHLNKKIRKVLEMEDMEDMDDEDMEDMEDKDDEECSCKKGNEDMDDEDMDDEDVDYSKK